MMSSILDQLAEINHVCRMTWMDEPKHLNKDDYIYNPTYSILNPAILLYNYEESDISLRERISR